MASPRSLRSSRGSRSRVRPLTAGAAFALVCATMVVLAAPASAAVATQSLEEGATAEQLATTLAGDGVTVSEAAFTGDASAGGTFSGGAGIIGLGSGVVLSSGQISTVIGPNDQTGAGTAFGGPGDGDLDALSGATTSDAAVLEFDFVPTTSQVQFSYVFSSEEYNEFVGGGFNDSFGFFVNGTNCAEVGDPAVPVTVDTINAGSNPSLFIDNTDAHLDTQMDGLTVVLTCLASVNPDVTNHMKLAIADAGDSNLDSAVFLGQNSFVAVHTLSVSTAGEGSGTVTSDPAGIDCGEDCSEGYEEGTAVTLTATPDDGSTFDGWSGDCTGTGPCEVTMDAPHDVTATFGTGGTSCGEGSECDEGTLPPGGTLSTVQGTPANPVSPDDPFALGLENVSGQTITGSIVEELCDGTQEGDALCSTPRIGNSAGNFQFSTGSEALVSATAGGTGPAPVTVGTLFFDKSVVRGTGPARIFYQKEFGGPVLKLKRCKGSRTTECFKVKKLKSGDQVVTVPFKDDPRVTRG